MTSTRSSRKTVGFQHHERWLLIIASVGIGLILHQLKFSAIADTSTTFTPTVIPISSTEITNPGRGQYIWYPQYHPNTQPSGQPAGVDLYSRWGWSDIEPTQGNYNFSEIDSLLASAKTHGGKFGFSIGAVNALTTTADTSLPAYLRTTTNALIYTNQYGAKVTVPDWNNAFFQARWAALMQALGNRYNNDSRLSYYEIGGYGDWGEWHNYPYESSYPGPQGQTEMTYANAQKMIDATTSAFSKKTVLTEIIGTRITSDPTKMQDKNLNFGAWAFQYAMSKPNVGIRNACLGGGSVEQSAFTAFADDQKLGPVDPAQRWKTNLFTTEWCNNITTTSTDGTFAKGQALVSQYHISSLSNANFQGSVDSYPAAAQTAYIMANKTAGYRYQLNSITVPSTVYPKTTISLASNWSNVNVAPTYDPWTVQYQLRTPSTQAVVAQVNSSLDLRKVLPGSTSVTDNLAIGSLATGSYDLTVSVTDPTGYYAPMNLAITGKTSGGYYPLGKITISAAPVTTPPTTTPPTTTPPTTTPPTTTPPSGTGSGGTTTVPVSTITVTNNTPTTAPTVSGVLIVKSNSGTIAKVSVDGKQTTDNVIDTTKLTNGKHQITVQTTNGQKKTENVIVKNPFRLTSWVKQYHATLGSIVLLALLAVAGWQARLFYMRRRVFSSDPDITAMPPPTMIHPRQ